ncbi:PREDICTED: putative receptor-like protein kinase At3g47110 isoform X2 [Nelumbo nucifera]|uniref:non-specific serine/threonine protein kinase n=2 Tax=Nelumbo nucifera TaxID=4432 RepID=A0A1U8AKJ9_NELNU|nr:PREDICTED: putative receptor-like protein kinase At3g47110 isoform X2 [Nelumbo nucifera]
MAAVCFISVSKNKSSEMLLSFITRIVLLSSLNLLLGYSESTLAATFGNDTDRLALIEFNRQIIDPLGVLSSWNDSTHLCQWYGVTCDERNQRVTSLNLEGHKLAGTMSPYVGNLSFLVFINLQNNSFHGNIPQEVGRLLSLQGILLNNNSFGGEIPVNLSRCSNLMDLRFEFNSLEGKVPAELGSLTKLVTLSLRGNDLTGGIPTSIGNLSSLRFLSLARNNLNGTIPDVFGQMKSMQHFGLQLNQLSSTIPSSIYNLSSITYIALTNNKLHGSLRPDIGLIFPNLQILWIGGNRFTGPIPISLANASGLIEIDIPYNNFTGPVPLSLGHIKTLQWLNLANNHIGRGEADDLNFIASLINCSDLWTLRLQNCNFGGILPNSIANLSTRLTWLSLGFNKIVGKIPIGIENLENLIFLDMRQNFFKGSIPDFVGKLSVLEGLLLDGNRFSGEVPSSIGNLTKLVKLYLQNNNLGGRIPSTISSCQGLQEVILSYNELNDTIPKEAFGLSSLSVVLDISHNSLTGTLPLEVGNLKNLGRLDVSFNRLSGEIPSMLGDCSSLEHLYMQSNFFRGSIPSSFSNLKAIQDLDLSNNNLSGQIPEFLGTLQFLLYLNLSFNNLEGEVPVAGVFENASVISISGNSRLCGGIPELELQACLMEESKKKGTSLALKLIPAIVGVVLLLTAFIFFVIWLRKPKKISSSNSSPGESSTQTFGKRHLRVSYEELFKATDGFSTDNLIGSGSSGAVYKGILNQVTFAVKVLNIQQQRASKSFMTECNAMRNILHRNLIKIITACSSMDVMGNEFKALVFEFMPNGSLEDWLHPGEEGNTRPRKLSFLEKLNIAIDVASALQYLHHQCHVPIVHCDLKPGNVLLDNDMTAHVSDFGISRLLSRSTKNSFQNQSSSVALKGTIGYAAPEYGMGLKVSTHGDVYSYGILLLEMFTGRRPTDEIFKDVLNLHNFCKAALPEKVMEIAGPLFLYEEEAEQIGSVEVPCSNELLNGLEEKIQKCLISVIGIGVACSAESPRERMDMNEVTREMHLIRDIFLGSGNHRYHEENH